MMRPVFTLLIPVTTVALLGHPSLADADDDAGKVKVSSFAPAKDTEAQLEYFLNKIGRDLDNKDEYDDTAQSRVALDASTVAVLALMLGMHDEKPELKQSASVLIELAVELADSADDFDEAAQKLGELKQAVKTKPEGEELSWDEPVGDLAMLMQQVPIVNDPLRRGVMDKRRFARNAKQTAGRAIALAAIAQASITHTDYCSDEEDEKEWKKICEEMRDACADIYKALMAKDQNKAKEGNARVVKTCDACHHKFRD